MVKRKQMWGDPEFVITLEKIKAQRLINGNPVKSLPDLTREILESESFKKVVEEVLKKTKIETAIRFDKKRIW